MKVLKPPTPLTEIGSGPVVFLAGSIEMGVAVDWQSGLEKAFADLPGTILNPRRDAWDASWKQTPDNPQFRGQVEWELDGQEQADAILFYFAPGTQAPISLLELGLFSTKPNGLVCCPEEYWRSGNVYIVCERHGIPVVRSLEALETEGRALIQRLAAPSP